MFRRTEAAVALSPNPGAEDQPRAGRKPCQANPARPEPDRERAMEMVQGHGDRLPSASPLDAAEPFPDGAMAFVRRHNVER